jgi:hypothetical protein
VLALSVFVAPLWVVSALEFEAPIVIESPNAITKGWFGAGVVSAVPDVTGDGKADILVCAVAEFGNQQTFQTAGRVYLFDGITKELVRELRSPNERFNSRFRESTISTATAVATSLSQRAPRTACMYWTAPPER